MNDLMETYFLSREEISQLENALENADERIKKFINKYIEIYDNSIAKCLENPNTYAVNFLRYYLKYGQVPLFKKEIEI